MNWIKEIRAEFRSLEYSNRKLKQFGWLMILIFGAVLVYLRFVQDGQAWLVPILSITGILLISTIFRPELLKPFYRVWMGLAVILGWFVSRLILTLIFFLVLSPLALIAKISGRHFLDLEVRPSESSYWRLKEKQKPDYTKMY